MAAFYGGMKYSSLQTRYEGHVGNRNPILGIGHVAHDEAHFDVEGNAGRGGRGPKSLRSRQQQMQKQMQKQNRGAVPGGARQLRQGNTEDLKQERHQQYQPQSQQQQRYEPQSSSATAGPNGSRRGSFADLATPVSVDAWRAAVGAQSPGKRGHGVHAVSGASPAIANPEHYRVARNVNFNLRKPQKGVPKMQYRTPSDKYFGGSTTSDINKEYNNLAGTALSGNPEERPQDRGLLRASQEFGKNPITGEGHVSWDEADRDLDGRHGAGSRGATGNRTSNHQNAPHMGRCVFLTQLKISCDHTHTHSLSLSLVSFLSFFPNFIQTTPQRDHGRGPTRISLQGPFEPPGRGWGV